MAFDFKAATPDTSLPTTGFLFGADSQVAASPSIFSIQTVATTLLGSSSLTGNTETTSKPLFDLSQIWNAGGVAFTGLKANFTDTASAAASLLMDLQVGASSKFSITKAGAVTSSGGFGSALGTLTDGATINWNAAAASNGAVVQVTIAATGRTMAAPTNLTSGVFYTLFVKQDGTGSRTITTWNAAFVWPGGTAPTLTTTANKRDCFVFYYDGSNLINVGQTYNLA